MPKDCISYYKYERQCIGLRRKHTKTWTSDLEHSAYIESEQQPVSFLVGPLPTAGWVQQVVVRQHSLLPLSARLSDGWCRHPKEVTIIVLGKQG
jgi:hypothetical protein